MFVLFSFQTSTGLNQNEAFFSEQKVTLKSSPSLSPEQ